VIPKVKENNVRNEYATFDLGGLSLGKVEERDGAFEAYCFIDNDEYRGSFDACQTWLYARLLSFGFDVELEHK
jgi:hypothetical protein